MNFFVISTFVMSFFVDYFAKQLGLISRYFVLLPELMSAIAVLIIMARVLAGRRLQMDSRYAIFLVVLFLTFMMGIVAQNVPSGAVVSGLRDHVRYIPFLLLPAVYDFTDRQLKTQLVVLLGVLALQTPLTIFQRFFQFAHRMTTGDVVRGTVSSGSSLSLLLLCAIAALVVFYLRKRISLTMLLVGVAVLLVPTMINETKGTLVLLPVAMLGPIFFMRRRERPVRRLVPLIGIFIVGGFTFIGVYNYLLQYIDPGASIQAFYTEGGASEYLYKGTPEGDHRVGRFDSIEIAARKISETPLGAFFGLGIGNASAAVLPGFEGDYAGYYERYQVSKTQISYLLWELGAAGLLIYGLFYFWMIRDSIALARSGGSFVMLGHIWLTVMAVMTLSLLYKSYFTMSEIVYPFWFYSGVVASKVYALREESRLRRSAATAPGPVRTGWREAAPVSYRR